MNCNSAPRHRGTVQTGEVKDIQIMCPSCPLTPSFAVLEGHCAWQRGSAARLAAAVASQGVRGGICMAPGSKGQGREPLV